MIQQIQEVVRYFSHKYHVPIALLTDAWQVESWDREGIAVAIPGHSSTTKTMGDMLVLHEPEFAKQLPSDLVVCDEVPVARIGKNWLVFLIHPKNSSALAFMRTLIDQQLPRMCRQYRHDQRDQLVSSIATCVQDRKRELQSSIREDSYELERLSIQTMQLSRKLETDKQILRMFERSPEWIANRATHSFVDLMKLVPGVYANIVIDDETVTGTTHAIDIDYDGYAYHFDPYEVEVNLRQGKVFIGGGTNVNGYTHPHCTDDKSNICWGNIGHLVSRLAGELDLFALFQLVHQFLTTYNENDPYQKIEKWDPNWEDDEEPDEPYCSWCDTYGHEIRDCEDCWWCEYCDEYVDHDEEDCPNRPKQESEEVHELVEEAA